MASSTSKCRGCLNKANSFCYVCCKPCYNALTVWSKGKKSAFNFSVQMIVIFVLLS